MAPERKKAGKWRQSVKGEKKYFSKLHNAFGKHRLCSVSASCKEKDPRGCYQWELHYVQCFEYYSMPC
ncbi:unnamed protein product [Hermetia illucens]|uniref:Uncharacterized protein n=1 Tax=Hermetia illucens TaxID=343691 RepID=A0A7R8UE66_HERIL|nr:unnamed protein product [Hermetia illucens]